MRIGIQTWGSEGDVRPLLALAAGFVRRGHAVRLAVTCVEGRSWANDGNKLGVDVEDIGLDFFREQADEIAKKTLAIYRARGAVLQLKVILELLYDPVKEEMMAASRRLAAESDLVVGHFVLDTLPLAAELSGTRYVSVSTVPNIPCGSMAPVGAPDLGPLVNRLTWWLGGKVFNWVFLPAVNDFRIRQGARPIHDILSEGMGSSLLNLVAVSPSLVPHASDWPAHSKICGFFKLGGGDFSPVPPALERFLDNGPPPVFFTFGSMLTVGQPREYIAEVASVFLETARRVGERAIIQAPWEKLGLPAASPGVLLADRVPHAAVFPACRVIVHHGGAGTTQAALLAGKPSVVVPHAADQAFWAVRLRRLGTAPRPLDRRRLGVRSLVRRIRRALETPLMTSRAANLGLAMRAEDGVAEAVRAIEAL